MKAASQRLKVALISSGLGHVLRGVEVWMLELARLLPRDRVEVLLWSGGKLADAPAGYSSLHGLSRDAALISQASWHRRYMMEQWSVLPTTILRLRTQKVDIAYCGDPVLSWHLNRFQKLHGAKVVFMNGMRLSPNWARPFGGVHLLAQPYLEQARQDIGVEAARNFFAVPHCADVEMFHPPSNAEKAQARAQWKLSPEDYLVLTIGPLGNVSGKRLEWLAQELQPLDRRIKLVHAGVDEDGRDEVTRQVREALGNRIHFCGRVPRAEMPRLYQAADVYSLGSLAEPFSIAILEAMSSGLPVVHHNDAVMMWQTGEGGTPVSMTTHGEAGAAIQRLAVDPTAWQQKSRAARQLAETRYHPTTVCLDLIAAWQRLLAPPK